MSTGASDGLRPRLDLPPFYSLVTLRESGDAHAHACAIAPQVGAGTLVYVGRFDLVEFAVILEPEEHLVSARRAFFAGMAAIADSLAAHCPPEKPLAFSWPDTIHFDGALLGGGRLAWPQDCPEDKTPDWLVFSAQLISARVGGLDPGYLPHSTTLSDEGFDDGRALVESFSRHLMVWFDAWNERGFKPVADAYLARLPKDKAGERRGIDGNGDLLVHRSAGAAERRALVPTLREPGWYDPKRGGPRL
jgi:hypothetical protein